MLKRVMMLSRGQFHEISQICKLRTCNFCQILIVIFHLNCEKFIICRNQTDNYKKMFYGIGHFVPCFLPFISMMQCDQIGLFLEGLDKKFSLKSSQKITNVWAILKNVTFWAITFGEKLSCFYSYIWSPSLDTVKGRAEVSSCWICVIVFVCTLFDVMCSRL